MPNIQVDDRDERNIAIYPDDAALKRFAATCRPQAQAPNAREQSLDAPQLGPTVDHEPPFDPIRTCVMNTPPDPNGNELLAVLPAELLLRWKPHLQWLDMPLGQVLYVPGDAPTHVFFPVTAIVSLLFVSESGSSSEISVVGREGLVGISIFMGGGSTPGHAVVQCAGEGFRLEAGLMREEFNLGGQVTHLMLRYTQALVTQMAQTAVCNRHHSLDQQLCRWLLLSLDRRQGNELVMTQELIAANLGVRREGVTEAAHRLQEAGLIRYARGRIKVLDRPALEARTCECYAVVKREYDRLLPRRRPD